MGRALALCLLPVLAACLALALAFMGFQAALPWPAVALLVASAVLFALGCAKVVGYTMYRSYHTALGGEQGRSPLDDTSLAASKRTALAFCAAGAVCLVVAFAVGGPVLTRLFTGLLAL